MEKTEYKAIETILREEFGDYSPVLSAEGRENVEHFLGVSEIEMACETFLLSVLEEGVELTGDSKKRLLCIATKLELDKDSVFRADFWNVVGPLLGEAI